MFTSIDKPLVAAIPKARSPAREMENLGAVRLKLSAEDIAAIDQVIERAHAARSNHRHVHGVGDGAGQLQVEAKLGAIAIHGSEHDFACAECLNLFGPGNGINAGAAPPAMGENFPTTAHIAPAGINRDHDGLAAESLSRAAHQIRVRDRG